MTPSPGSLALEPNADFDWEKVTWTKPRGGRPTACSYCGSPLLQQPRIIIIHDNGHGCEFCAGCFDRYWPKYNKDEPAVDLGGLREAAERAQELLVFAASKAELSAAQRHVLTTATGALDNLAAVLGR